jgi:hypothetical protein
MALQTPHRKDVMRLRTQRVWQAKLGPNTLVLKSCLGVAVFSNRSMTQINPEAEAGAMNGALFTTEQEPA